jgi:protein-L-isoaspartate O-methyltransferase
MIYISLASYFHTGRVTGVDVVPELVARSLRDLSSDPATSQMCATGAISMHAADAHRGWSENAPYDAIHGK